MPAQGISKQRPACLHLGAAFLRPTPWIRVPTPSDPCACAPRTVFDNVRSNVPHMLLDDVFTAKEEIATSVKEELVRQPVPPCMSLGHWLR